MLLSAALAALAAGASAADLASRRFHQDRFLISYWVGPQVPLPELDERFAEIAAANFTGHLGFNGNGNSHGLYNDSDIHPTKERVSAEIALCDKYDLACIPTLCGKFDVRGALPEECLRLGENSPNFWGFQLLDEPSSSLFPAMGNFSKRLAAARPKALQYYNLLGSGAFPFVNLTTYEDYWSSYIASVNPCASLALSPLPLIFSYKSEKSLCGTGMSCRRTFIRTSRSRAASRSPRTSASRRSATPSRWPCSASRASWPGSRSGTS